MNTTEEFYDFDAVIPRKGTDSVKWDFIPAGDDSVRDDLLPLWIADMDFPCARPIIDALRDRVDGQIFGYSMAYSESYLDAVTGWFKTRAGWEIDPAAIKVAPGIVPALGVLIRTLTDAGDGVIIQSPVYYPFSQLIRKNNRKLVNNPLIEEDGRYRMDFDDLEAKAKAPETKLLLLCNPHNPVGRLWTREELSRLADICLKNNVLIISDDIHCDLVRDPSGYTPLSTVNSDQRIITCTAASKTFNLAGLQISNIVINDPEIQNLWEEEIVGRCGIMGVGAMGIVATRAAYTQGLTWLDQVNAYISDNLRYVEQFVAERLPKARFRMPEGTYFAWIDFREYGYSAEQLEKTMVFRAKVALDEGYIFGKEGSGFERINTACPRSVLRDCLERMEKALS